MKAEHVFVSWDNWSGVFIMHIPGKQTRNSDGLIKEIYERLKESVIPESADPSEIYSCAGKLFAEGQYNSARTVLNQLNKLDGNKPDVLLMKILCSYGVKNTEELLAKAGTRVYGVQKLAENHELNTLANKLKFDHNLFVVHILEYMLLGLRLSGEDMSAFYDTLRSDAVKKKPESVFAKLDAEEAHNEERVRKLKDADKPEEASIPKMVSKFMNTAPEADRYDGRPCSAVADSLAGNIILDVVDMLVYERGESFYEPKLMSRTRKYNARTNEAKAHEAEQESKAAAPYDDISLNPGMTDEEMRIKRENILKLIIEEEKQIFRDTGMMI